jgi:hypothetical protein
LEKMISRSGSVSLQRRSAIATGISIPIMGA